jgi:hypothetical protein
MLSVMVVNNSLTNEKIYYETDSFKIVKAESLFTNELYMIKSKHVIFEQIEAKFQTTLNLENSKIIYGDRHVEIIKADTIIKIKIEN